MSWSVYILSCPRTKQVRYVGWTSKSINSRLNRHINDSITTIHRNHRQKWIMSLVSIGLRPEATVIETGSDEDWGAVERRWIAFYLAQGAKLVNGTEGGEGRVGLDSIPTEDLTGQRYFRLLVKRQVPKARIERSTVWLCICDCGAEKVTSSQRLKSGHAKSCGCLNREVQRQIRHGMAYTGTWAAWKDMKARCSNTKKVNYAIYGGRGIRVCAQWESFDGFLADMGRRPDGKSLGRRNTDGNYEPGNAYWATKAEQGRGTRRNRFIEIDGRTQTISEWAREYGIHRSTMRLRLARNHA